MCPWNGYFFPLSTQGESELRLRCLLCRLLRLGEPNPIPAAQRTAGNGGGKRMGGGACRSQPNPKPFLSCALHMQFELPHTSNKLPKSMSNLGAGFPGFLLCRLLPAFPLPSILLLPSCWDAGKALELTCHPPLMQQSLWLLIFCPIDLNWLKDGQEVLCGLGCIET